MKLKRLRNLPGKKRAPNSAREPVHLPATAGSAACHAGGERHAASAQGTQNLRAEPCADRCGGTLLRFCRAAGSICSVRGLSEGTVQREEQSLGKLGSGEVTCSECPTHQAGMAVCDPASHLHRSALLALNAFCCNARDRCLKTKAGRFPRRVPYVGRWIPATVPMVFAFHHGASPGAAGTGMLHGH